MSASFPYKVYNHPFGVKEYVCDDEFTLEEIEISIKYLDQKYFSVGNIQTTAPGLQTPYYDKLLDQKEFEKIRNTYLECVREYVNQKDLIDKLDSGDYNSYGWCYLNWKSSPRAINSRQWHEHNPDNPNAISGIFYLKIPETPGGETVFRIGGNEFELPSNKWRWFLFPSGYKHVAGKYTNEKRYVMSADLWYDWDDLHGFLE